MSKTEGKKDKKREKQSKDDDKKVKKSLKSLDAMPSEVSTEAPPAKAPAPVREEQSEAPLQPRGLFNSAEKTFEVFYPEESVKLTIKKVSFSSSRFATSTPVKCPIICRDRSCQSILPFSAAVSR